MNIQACIDFAIKKHKGQKRKNGDDYITHPLRVYSSVKSFGDDVAIVGLFHDLLEDTDATEEEILNLSNEKVLEAVKLLTKTKDNKKTYLKNIVANDLAKIVKNADRIDNLNDILILDMDVYFTFIEGYLKNTKKYLNIFSPELDQLYEELKIKYQNYCDENFLYTINGSMDYLTTPLWRVNKNTGDAYVYKNNLWVLCDPEFWIDLESDALDVTYKIAKEIIAIKSGQ